MPDGRRPSRGEASLTEEGEEDGEALSHEGEPGLSGLSGCSSYLGQGPWRLTTEICQRQVVLICILIY